ncbi:unnamed protein product [Laminaria digitata]
MASEDEDYGWFHVPSQGGAPLLGREGSLGDPCCEDGAPAHTEVSLCGGGADAGPRRTSQPDLVTRSFLCQSVTPVWAWGVAGLRVVRGRKGVTYAEFRIVASLDERRWDVWKRMNKIAKLAKKGREAGAWSSSVQLAWDRLSQATSGHCEWRDPRYLRHVCALVHDFFHQYLFVCDDLDSLVEFVTAL